MCRIELKEVLMGLKGGYRIANTRVRAIRSPEIGEIEVFRHAPLPPLIRLLHTRKNVSKTAIHSSSESPQRLLSTTATKATFLWRSARKQSFEQIAERPARGTRSNEEMNWSIWARGEWAQLVVFYTEKHDSKLLVLAAMSKNIRYFARPVAKRPKK